MSGNYSVRYEIVGTIPVMYIVGDMTSDADNDVMTTYGQLKEANSVKYLIFNFSETNYINSAGLATLINIIQEMNKAEGKVAFTQLNSHFQKVMDIVGITDFVSIYDSNEDAVKSIQE
jgi:anti-anti-sigma factor